VVVDINETAIAFVSEQFRIWTLSRQQTTSITIETAVWSLFRINRRDALTALADYNMHFEDFTARLQHGEDTDDSLDGVPAFLISSMRLHLQGKARGSVVVGLVTYTLGGCELSKLIG
jgi:hypothetical protein